MLGNEGMIQRRKSMHSAGFFDGDGIIWRHRYFEFQVNNTQTISGLFSTIAGQDISVDWGDGSARSTYSGTDQVWSKDYGSAGDRTVRIFGSVVLTKFMMDAGGADISFDIANAPTGLTYLNVWGSNTVSGDIANAPTGLTYLCVWGSNTVSGDIANAPTGLTVLSVGGSNTVSGDIANAPTGLTYLSVGRNNTLSGDIANAPTGLTYLGMWGNNTVSGDIANAPTGLTYLCVWGSNTVSGDIANTPTGLTVLSVGGSNTVSGDIANAPTGLTVLNVGGSNTVSGDIANEPVGLTYLNVGGNNTIADYTGKTWTTKPAVFYLIPVGAGGLSTAEVDQLLIDFDDDLVWAAGNVITLTGVNAARSAASDAAVASMVAEGATVTTN